MSEVPLLNPQEELEGAKRLLQIVTNKISGMETVLLQTEVDRETYLKQFGAMIALREVHAKMEREYRGMVNK